MALSDFIENSTFERIDGHISSLQIEWHAALKIGRLKVLLWKKYIAFTKAFVVKEAALKIAVFKSYSTPKEN